MVVGLFIIPVFFVLVFGCLVGLGWLWWRVLRRPLQGMPTCGQCGYIVEGLSELTCPECGGDFRKVGIDTPRQRGAVGPAVFTTLWTLLLPILALVAIGLAIAFGPMRHSGSISFNLTNPTSQAYQSIGLNVDVTSNSPAGLQSGVTSQGPGSTRSTTLTFGSPGSVPEPQSIFLTLNGLHTLHVDSATGGYRYIVATPTADRLIDVASGFDPHALRRWMQGAGVDTTISGVDEEINEITAAVLAIAGGQSAVTISTLDSSLGSSSWSTYPAPWYLVLNFAAWLLIWLGGIVLYIAIRRRRAIADSAGGRGQA